MSLIKRIKSALGLGPKLRNRSGGMAWIRGIPTGAGAEQLNGRAVKTVRLDETGLWQIEPLQSFICTESCKFGLYQRLIIKGQVVTVEGIADERLEPWRDIGDGAQDESAQWLPPVPTQRKEPAHV